MDNTSAVYCRLTPSYKELKEMASSSSSSLPSRNRCSTISHCCHRSQCYHHRCCCLAKSHFNSSSIRHPHHQRLASSYLIAFVLITLSFFTQSSSAYDASYSVVGSVRTSHICFFLPNQGRPDRVTVERWFFNATTRNCEPYQLELNAVDTESRNQQNDFPSFRACHRLCYRIVRNMSEAEIEARIRDGGVYYADDRPSPHQMNKQKAPVVGNKQRTPSYVAAPTIVVSNIDAKARREHHSGSSASSSTRSRDQQQAAQQDESVWSSSAYKQGRKKSGETSSGVSLLLHPTTQLLPAVIFTLIWMSRYLL